MKRVFAFIGFSVALTLIVLNLASLKFACVFTGISALFFIITLLVKNLRQARVVPIVMGSVLFACLIFVTAYTSSVLPCKQLDNVRCQTEFKIVDIEKFDVDSDCFVYKVKTQKINKSFAPQNIILRLKSSKKIMADYYDTITADLKYYDFCDNAFDSYGEYSDGVYIKARLSGLYSVEKNDKKPLNYYIIKLRLSLINKLETYFRGDTSGLAIALLTGDKSYLSTPVVENLRICGMSHFFAVSGFHISLICLGFYSILRLLKCPKLVNTILTVFLTVVYCGVADFSSSAVRAAVMIFVMLVSQLFRYKADGLNSLGFAVFVICLNPFAVTDVSAFLSVSAMLGIYVVYRGVYKKHKYGNKLYAKIDSINILSNCILLSLLPAVYIFFGNVSVGSCFLNIIVQPLIIILLVFIVAFCFCPASLFLLSVLVKIINFISSIILSALDYISSEYSWIYLRISGAIFGISLAAIFIFLAVCIFVKKKIPVKPAVAFAVVVLVLSSFLNYYQCTSTGFTYVDNRGMVVIYDIDSAVVVGMDSSYDRNKAEKLVGDKNVVFIDCKEYVDGVELDTNLSENLCEDISYSVDNKIINVTVFDKHFKIEKDYVIIKGASIKRNRDDDSITMSYSYKTELDIRRDSSGTL